MLFQDCIAVLIVVNVLIFVVVGHERFRLVDWLVKSTSSGMP